MISSLKHRILAGAVTMLLAAHPQPICAKPRAATAKADAFVQLPHISITTVGSGSPVVLIPGLSSPRTVWDDTAAALAAGHQVVLAQVNGFAGEAPGANLAPGLLDGIVADLHEYLAQRKLSHVSVIGHSLGGLVAMMWAKAHPGDVGRAMIVDALPYVGEIFVPGATVAMLEPRARMMRDGMAATFGQPANAAIAEQTANGLALRPASRVKVKAWSMAADPRVAGEALYEDLTTDLRPDLAGIATPLTVVVPFNAGLPEAQAVALYTTAYAKAPHTVIVPIADSAHFVMLDQPATFQTAVHAFLAKREQAPSYLPQALFWHHR